jgi:AcrR family transcriptional regulator
VTSRDGDGARRTNRSSARVRQDLLEAAARLARERGVAGVTYREIAAEARVSDSVLLRHFGTKNDLLVDAVVGPFAASLAEMARIWRGGPADSTASNRAFLTELHDGLSRNRSIMRTVLAAEAAGDEDPILVGARSRLREVFAGLADVTPGVEAERGAAPFEPELTARTVIAMMVAVTALDDVLFPGPAGPPAREDLISALTGLTSHGRAGRPDGGPR